MAKRVLVVHPGPRFSTADVWRGWCRGLTQLGVEVFQVRLDDYLDFYACAHVPLPDGTFRRAFDYDQSVEIANRQILAAVMATWPVDLVLIVAGGFVSTLTMDVLHKRNIPTALLATECPYENYRIFEWAQYFDHVLLNDPTDIDEFRERVPSTHYFAHAYDPEIHHPRPTTPGMQSDFVFIGTFFDSRMEFFEAVDWCDVDVRLGGQLGPLFAGERIPWGATPRATDSPLTRFAINPGDECLDNERTVEWYASSKSSANLYRREAQDDELSTGWAMGPREVELAACGVFFLRDPRPEGDEVLPMLPKFSSPGDFREKLHWWLRHDVERNYAAIEAREAIADRTFKASAGRLLGIIEH